MRPHPNKLLTIGLVRPAIKLAIVLAMLPTATAASGIVGVSVDVVLLVSVVVIVGQLQRPTAAQIIPITAMVMPVDLAHRTTRTTLQDLVVMVMKPPMPI